jgi:antitoxin component of MazEF toxin-antitoxin module
MLGKIQKWINILAVKIPKPSTGKLIISENSCANSKVNIETKSIKPFGKGHGYKLNAMVDQINENNLQGEYDTGKPMGKEIW